MNQPRLHVVHCIDTEGPLDEDLASTFKRISDIFDVHLSPSQENLLALQNKEIDLGGLEEQIAKVVSPQLMDYNRTWDDVNEMLEDALSQDFRNQMLDDDGKGWVYSWHCVDHIGYEENPRNKDLGYGNIFHAYRRALEKSNSTQDEINWHFHPLSLTRKPLAAATSFGNSMDLLLYLIARRVIDENWFPSTNRPGFHSERPDANAFFEQWIPFDYANQACSGGDGDQQDTQLGRFGDWRRAPKDWLGYHPDHDDYQSIGNCRRWIFRCLNVGTRLRCLAESDVKRAFEDAIQSGSAILAFADHDFRDIRPDVNQVRAMLEKARKEYPQVHLNFSGAEQAACSHVAVIEPALVSLPPEFGLRIDDNRLHVELKSGKLFGPQPFLAIKGQSGNYFHDNFDIITPSEHWTYVFDDQTLPLSEVSKIGVAAAGRSGGFGIAQLDV